jgi:hypothetical protein
MAYRLGPTVVYRIGLLVASLTVPAAAAPQSAPASSAQLPVARAVPLAAGITLDGRLDEPGWFAAMPVTAFTQLDPDEGEEVSERTEVFFVYDDEALYVGARLYDRSPVTSRLLRRDADVQDSDWFVVALDSYHDHLTSYRFTVNPAGVRRDEVITSGGTRIPGQSAPTTVLAERGGLADASWDPVWSAAAAVTDSGWVAELRIPFGQLRFSRAEVQTWGLQIERRIARKQEQALFAFSPKDQPAGVALYGHLEGLTGIKAPRPLEILPYGSGSVYLRPTEAQTAAVAFPDPLTSRAELTGGIGADVKYRLSSNFTLDATLNPDFGQVELDPAVVNLTAFETRFDEKRPFFVEGAEILRFGTAVQGGPEGGPPQLIYSRRIGRAPQLAAPGDAVYADLPETTTILGAAKVTGRTLGGWSVGVLEAVTQRESGLFVDAEERRYESVVEPLTNYLAGRLRRDVNGGRSLVGGLFTATHRRMGGPMESSALRDAAYAAGLDFRHESDNRVWSVFGSVASSHVRGSEEAIRSTQRSSARYFQRPDAGHLEVDPDATSLSGYRAQVDFGKRSGTWLWNVAATASSPGLELNDMGFLTLTDRILLDPNLTYEQNRPGAVFRRWSVRSGPDFVWNYDGDLVRQETFLTFQSQLHNYWTATVRASYARSVLSDRLTRGGPLTRLPALWSTGVTVGSDPRQSYTLSATVNRDEDRAGLRETSVGLDLGFKPASSWEFEVGPVLTTTYLPAQYVTAVADPTAPETFASRYVFASLDQSTFGIDTRLNATFTPGLSLELYAQPFLSSNDYGALKELRAPRTFDFLEYGVDAGTIAREPGARTVVDPDGAGPAEAFRVEDRDFDLRSLRGNAVLRWEWRPGSTLYVVWQQERSDLVGAANAELRGSELGSFDLREQARDLFRVRPINVLMFKVSYWLNP